jgi:hypothetical protein
MDGVGLGRPDAIAKKEMSDICHWREFFRQAIDHISYGVDVWRKDFAGQDRVWPDVSAGSLRRFAPVRGKMVLMAPNPVSLSLPHGLDLWSVNRQ